MAQGQPEVVIVDKAGQEHVFPPGFDPKRAAAIVRQRAASVVEQSAPSDPIAAIEQGEAERTQPWREFVAGGAKRLAEMGIRGGALLRKIPGVSAVAEALPSVEVPIDRATGTERAGATALDLATIARTGGLTGRLMQGARLPARMAAEAGTMAGVAELQGADPRSAAVLGAAIPAAGAVVSRATQALPQALRDQATKKVAQALGATKERFKAIAEKRAPEILKRGLRGSRARLLEDATAHARAAGQAVDDGLALVGQHRAPTAPILDALEEAKSAYTLTRTMSVSDAAKAGLLKQPGIRKLAGDQVEIPIVLDQRPIAHLTQLQQTIRELGDDATVEQLVAVRRVWDEVVERAGGFAHRRSGGLGVPLAEQSEAWAKEQGGSAIRKLLADEVPDLAKVNAEFAFWADIKDIVRATQGRTQAQGPGLSRVVAGSVGAGAGFASGDDLESRLKMAFGGLVAGYVFKALTSANWRLTDARLRNALADAIVGGNPGQAMSAATRILAVKGASRQETSNEIAMQPSQR